MINAVFDKLPEDIHDFDLFTTGNQLFRNGKEV